MIDAPRRTPPHPEPWRIRRHAAAALCLLAACGASHGAEDAAVAPASASLPARPADGTLLQPIPLAGPSAAEAPARDPVLPTVTGFDGRLALLVAGLLAAVAVARRSARGAARPLPPEVFAVLGEAALGGTSMARVVRFGPKTILVASSGGTCTTLAEIDDPEATARLVSACRSGSPAPDPTLRRLVDAVAARRHRAATPMPAEVTP